MRTIRVLAVACLFAVSGCATVTPAPIVRDAAGKRVWQVITTNEVIDTPMWRVPPQTFRYTFDSGSKQVFLGEVGLLAWPYTMAPKQPTGLCIDPSDPDYQALYFGFDGSLQGCSKIFSHRTVTIETEVGG